MTTTATPDAATSTRPVSDGAIDVVYPTRRDEAWRYAPHQLLGRLTFGPSAAPAGVLPAGVDEQIPALDGPLIVVVNGVINTEHSNLAGLPAGLIFSSLADAPADHAALVGAHFAPNVEVTDDAFATLNKTFGVDGAFVHVADGQALDAPIHIVHVATPDETQTASCAGVVVHVGSGSSATIVESCVGVGEQFGGMNTRTTIVLDDDATLDHILLQDVPSSQVHLSGVDATQNTGSTLRAKSFNLGASYGRVAYNVTMAGEGAHVELSGLYYGAGEQTLDQQITVIHAAKDCTSEQNYRGVLDDSSTGVFNGAIDVRPGADGTDAEQSNDNLLLSHRAEVNSQPRLEILADDVKCKHGATVGQLDDTAMYYMRTRGIAADEARRLLIAAFAEQAVDAIDIDAVSLWIKHRLGTPDA